VPCKRATCIPKEGPFADSVPIISLTSFGETETIVSTDFFDIEHRCVLGEGIECADVNGTCAQSQLVLKEKFVKKLSVFQSVDSSNDPVLAGGLSQCSDNVIRTLEDDSDALECLLNDAAQGRNSADPPNNGLTVSTDDETAYFLSHPHIGVKLSAEEGSIHWVATNITATGEFKSNCGYIANVGVKIPKGVKFTAPALDMSYV